MVRIAPASSAFLLAASAITLCTANYEYKVRVKNLTYMQPFSPILMFAHTEEISAFGVGEKVSSQFRSMAEDGNMSPLLAQADDTNAAPHLCGLAYGSDFLEPGDMQTFTMVVDNDTCSDGATVFTMLGMLVNTNDAFVAINSAGMEWNSSMTFYPKAYDAGTEENNELCTHIPGPACAETSGNSNAGPGEGYVHPHRGIHGIGNISAAVYDWANPVAEVYIEEPTMV